MEVEVHGKHLLGNETSAAGPTTFQAYDPASGEDLPPVFHEATQAEVDHAMALAASAFDVLRDSSRHDRASLLETIASNIEGLGDGLLERARQETALPILRLQTERARTCFQLRMFAGVIREGSYLQASIDHGNPDRTPIPQPDLRRMRRPLGPVVVFGASNFPLAFSTAGGDTASALAAGCPVVVKGHPAHPGTAELAAGAILAALKQHEMPAGTFSLLQGASADVGRMLVEHPTTCAVGFTGSFAGGKALFDIAAARAEPIPVYAEMGSTNPVFLLPGAMSERAAAIAEGLAQSVTLGVGQFCTNPGLVFLVEGEHTQIFLDALVQHMANMEAGTMLHPGIRAGFDQAVARSTSVDGVTRLGDVGHSSELPGCVAQGTVLSTDATTFLSNPTLTDEMFGPATLLVRCKDVTALLELASNLPGQLTATVHGSHAELQENQELLRRLERRAGRLILNGFPTGVEVCPSMQHGGPFPATTDSRNTSVGCFAIHRFLRPVSYQNFPADLLPQELRDSTTDLRRLVNGRRER